MLMIRKTNLFLIAVAFILLAFAVTCSSAAAMDAPPQAPGTVKIYFFWGNGCPHCAHEKEFLDTIKKRYPQVNIEAYEVWQNPANARFFSQMTKSAGIKSTGVPVTFIDRRVFVGFSEHDKADMEKTILACLEQKCIDPADRLTQPMQQEIEQTIELPFFGIIDQSKASLPLITVILGGLDSFNPCAFFVLFFLLSLLVHARSRARMLMIGGTFVLFSGLIYFLFMAAWLNLFILAGNLSAITLVAGFVGLIVAALNIKDFFFYKKGVSLSIPESAKPKLFEKMRDLLKSTSLVSMLVGTVVLALAANTYELLCTAGFPMVFTRILTLHNLSPMTYYLYLALYNIVYIIPLSIIVAAFTITLGARKLTEWQGRKLKLISGLMMLFLGAILVIQPALLNNIFASAGTLAGALALFWLVVFIARRRGYGPEQSA
jgi:glutaredoxin